MMSLCPDLIRASIPFPSPLLGRYGMDCRVKPGNDDVVGDLEPHQPRQPEPGDRHGECGEARDAPERHPEIDEREDDDGKGGRDPTLRRRAR
jgi:hypothetical protein